MNIDHYKRVAIELNTLLKQVLLISRILQDSTFCDMNANKKNVSIDAYKTNIGFYIEKVLHEKIKGTYDWGVLLHNLRILQPITLQDIIDKWAELNDPTDYLKCMALQKLFEK